MKAKLHYVFSIAIFLFAFSSFAQNSPWKKIETSKKNENISKYHLEKSKVKLFKLDVISLKKSLSNASLRSSKSEQNNVIVSIPGENGTLERFKVFESPVFSPELAAQFPDIKSYVGYSLDNSGARLRMSVSPLGVQTMISYLEKPMVFMQPLSKDSNEYVLYNKASKTKTLKIECAKLNELLNTYNKTNNTSKTNDGGANNKTLQKFRIAISTTGEYTTYFGGQAGALAGINATLTRVNEVFENDMAVTFELVNAPQLIYTNAVTDPYSDADIGASDTNSDSLDGWSLQLQNNLTSVIGNSAYDIGHLFGATGGGGNAGCIGCVCNNDNVTNNMDKNKGAGFTSPSDGIPEGDTYDINYVAHEIGHQMGANHTWSFKNESSGVQAEPGSGSTIMAYAGVTDADDVQLNSDPYFHYYSIKQILDNLATKSCQTSSSITNNPPIANAGNNYTIPKGTAYVLKGSATDNDSGDNLTYCWEETDSGLVTSANFSSNLTSGSINRSLPPSVSPYRYIPNIKSVLNGKLTESNPTIGSSWESVTTTTRLLNWALTVRDRDPLTVIENGQTSYDTMTINVDGNSGPFTVTSQGSTNINWTPGTTETITWNVASTNSGVVNATAVNILLSTDGGLTYPVTLVSNTSNDGSQNISVPFVSAPFCRIKVEAVNNIFYAINSKDFAINYNVNTTCQPSYNSGLNLNLPINDGQEVTHTINVSDSGAISDVKVSVNISHTYVDDLVVTLTHPNGTTSAKVWNRNCSIENDIVMTFEDWATNINCNNTSVANTYAPAELLDVFNGLEATGNWKISVKDLVSGDNGTLNSWSLELCTQTTTLTNQNIEEEIVGIKVYPNPNDGNFWIAFNSESNREINIDIFDISGRLVLNKVYPNVGGIFRKKIKLSGISTGIYLLAISDGYVGTKRKIIIE